MKSLMQPARKAEAVRRSLSVFFIVGGLLATFGTEAIFSRAVGMMLGLPAVALGIAIFRYWSLARWAGMGACFLLLILAFALPLIITVPLEYHEFENARRAEYLTWAFAGAFGLIGYWGLQYFRAPAAKEAFAHSAEMLAAFRGESSSVVVTAALTVFCVWLMPAGIVWSEQTSAARTPAHGAGRKPILPDLVATGLCRVGDSLIQVEIANRGAGGSAAKYAVSYSALRVGGGGSGVSSARVPLAGTSGLVALDHASNPYEIDSASLKVKVTVDTGNTVRESNESNNTATFPIVFEYLSPSNLPKCPRLPEINGQ